MLLKVERVSYTITDKKIFSDKAGVKIIDNISFTAARGEIIGLTGESGSGKTTLAKIISGLIKPDSGSINLNLSKSFKNGISPVQILFQNSGDILNPYRRGGNIIKEVLLKREVNDPGAEVKRIADSLSITDELLRRRGSELSGGEQQRIALARVLACEPELLILDEPFSAQDPESQLNLFSLLKKIGNDYDVTIICISHYLRMLKELCSRIIVMFNGKIAEDNTPEVLFTNPSHPYTKFLISAEYYKLSNDQLQQRRVPDNWNV